MNSPRGLFVFFGECFRLGGQYTNNRDFDESFAKQQSACISHVELMNHVKTLGIEPVTYINTYDTRFSSELIEWYKSSLMGILFHPKLIGAEGLCRNAIQTLSDQIDTFEFVFFIRIDLFLKPKLMDVFTSFYRDPVRQTRILFPSLCWLQNHRTFYNCPRVVDTMVFIPKCKFELIKRQFYLSHDAWFYYRYHADPNQHDIDVMINTLHDSDSNKDLNPLYMIVGREECQTWDSPNHVFVRNTENVVEIVDIQL